MPRHQPLSTINPVMGNSTRVSRVVNCCVDASKPGASANVSNGAAAIPANVRSETATSSKPSTAFASVLAALGSSRTSRRLYTGTKDADNVPSPNKLRTAFGILIAAL